MLLPLSTSAVGAISLENHLALVALHCGHGNPHAVSRLLKVVYLGCFLREALYGRSTLDIFREGEAVIKRCTVRAQQGDGWSVSDADAAVLAQTLTLHDQQLASIPAHLFVAAVERLNRFIDGDRTSPIPGSTADAEA